MASAAHRRTLRFASMTAMLSVLSIATSASAGNIPLDLIFEGGFDKRLGINDTGVIACADNLSNDLSCPQSEFPGQDADFGQDADNPTGEDGSAGFRFTKRSAAGVSLPVSALDWACVRDDTTGLTWEVKSQDGTYRDSASRFTWHDTNGSTNGGVPGAATWIGCTTAPICSSQSYVDELNRLGYCRRNDWRLPKVDELQGIMDYSVDGSGSAAAKIDERFFPGTQPRFHWSSQSSALQDTGVWFVDLSGDGSIGTTVKSNPDRESRTTAYVIAVSGKSRRFTSLCNPTLGSVERPSNFGVELEGTVFHKRTELMWKRCPEGSDLDAAINRCSNKLGLQVSWQDALKRARAVNAGAEGENLGFTNWRVPNLKELTSILELSCKNPALQPLIFPGFTASTLWTSTVIGGNTDLVQVTRMNSGSSLSIPKSGDSVSLGNTKPQVWLVRDVN